MHFSVRMLVSYISSLATLEPGLGGPLTGGAFFRCSQVVGELLHTGPVPKARRPSRGPFVVWWP